MKFYLVLSKRNLYVFIAFLVAMLFIIGKAYSESTSVIDGSTHQKRINFLKSINLAVEENIFSSKEIIIPNEFDGVYKKYNKIQQEAGFDLARYKGENATLYTYRLNESKNVNLLIYKGNVIGGDVCQKVARGEIYPLR